MKPRRDITLGDMQDECRKRDGVCCGMESWEACKFFKVCPFQMQSRKALGWDLTDPPRFNEAQMALLRIMMDMGAEYATQQNGSIGFYTGAPMRRVAVVGVKMFDDGKTEYLAELLGKDAT